MDPDVKAAEIDRAWRAHGAERRRLAEPGDVAEPVELADVEPETGTVRFYRPDREFGFIRADADDADVHVSAKFLHRAGVDALFAGDRVEFVRRHPAGARSPHAARIRVIE